MFLNIHNDMLTCAQVDLASHLAARVLGLIVIPTVVYMAAFKAHFIILENSGPGDAQMSSLFQANLRNTEVGKDSPLEIAYGSRATIKNMGYGGGLLHSHVQTYPEGMVSLISFSPSIPADMMIIQKLFNPDLP